MHCEGTRLDPPTVDMQSSLLSRRCWHWGAHWLCLLRFELELEHRISSEFRSFHLHVSIGSTWCGHLLVLLLTLVWQHCAFLSRIVVVMFIFCKHVVKLIMSQSVMPCFLLFEGFARWCSEK